MLLRPPLLYPPPPVPLYSFFYSSFASLSPIKRPPDGLFLREMSMARAKITGANVEGEKENHGTNPVPSKDCLLRLSGSKDQLNINGQ